MKRLILAACAASFIIIGAVVPPASAQQQNTWYAPLAFHSGMSGCANNVSGGYHYALNGNRLEVRNVNGRMGEFTAAANGDINQEFRSPSGRTLTITGNVHTRTLYIQEKSSQCKYSTIPAGGQQAQR